MPEPIEVRHPALLDLFLPFCDPFLAALPKLRAQIEDAISSLENERDAQDIEVRVAVQPSWPLAHELEAITLENGSERGNGRIFWLAASSGHPWNENPYAPRDAWEGGTIEASAEDDEEQTA